MDLKRVLSFPPYPGDYLHPVVYACTAVMLLCLLISIMTYIVHHSIIRISRKGWHMLLNFLFHTAMTFGVFAGGINQIKYPVICQVVGIILHYSSLSSMLWLLFTARNICKEVSKAPPIPQDRDPPNQPRPKATIFRFYLVSGGIPLIIVGVTAAVSLDNYGSRDNAPYCWMAWEPSLGGFYGLTAFLVLVMCIYFLWTFVQLKRHPERKYELKAMTEEQQRLAVAEIGHCHAVSGEPGEHGDHTGCTAITASMLANEHSFKAQLRATAFTLFLFLATWVFGALAVSQGHFLDMIFSCLYGAFSVTLGLFLLIQHCAKRDDVWHRWWACCPNKPKVEVNGEPSGSAAPPTQSHSHTPSHGQNQIHCQIDSSCPGKPLLSPHLHSPLPHCKLGTLPSTQNHMSTCCATLHSPSSLIGSTTRPQSLPDELPRPTLPLQSCLKDRSKTRSFNRPRPCLRDYSYHMTSTSMDGSVHSSHLDSPHSMHLDNPLTCHTSHLDTQLSCHSPHPDNQLRCPSPSPHLESLASHGLHDSLSCHSAHLDSQLSCHRHMCCAKADPFSSICCHKADPFVSPCQAEDPDTGPLVYSCAKMADKEDETMLHLDITPLKATLSCSQATLSRKGTLSRRGTLSRNSSQHEDYVLTSDSTGNIRTGPWKNETTV
ncbi:adhesion G protein-coupled receptor A1-like isoform X1 [Sinocyclocheilus anshuiensis]|uniref:adhesion G protein-coupled receptor A1-like isoform X1 n=1 Tax=Sinocyclocheilus anshuiensis TaxID=1608454 RepID=UPI0007BA698C|nr:PREDICTED: adhesion G protein-coupled receptor A1-like isoform X1 [Sinocyclocheilus anshuiensis]